MVMDTGLDPGGVFTFIPTLYLYGLIMLCYLFRVSVTDGLGCEYTLLSFVMALHTHGAFDGDGDCGSIVGFSNVSHNLYTHICTLTS